MKKVWAIQKVCFLRFLSSTPPWVCLFPPFFLFFLSKLNNFSSAHPHPSSLCFRHISLSLFLSLFGVPFLSRSRARGAKNARARALNRTRRAGESLAPVGASELARARGEKPSPEFCVRANPKERVCWFPRVAQKRRGKERKVFCNRSLSCARACVAHGLSIYSSIDRSIGKEEQKWRRLCSRRLLGSRRSEEKIKTGGRTRRTPKTPPTSPKASRYY